MAVKENDLALFELLDIKLEASLSSSSEQHGYRWWHVRPAGVTGTCGYVRGVPWAIIYIKARNGVEALDIARALHMNGGRKVMARPSIFQDEFANETITMARLLGHLATEATDHQLLVSDTQRLRNAIRLAGGDDAVREFEEAILSLGTRTCETWNNTWARHYRRAIGAKDG